MSPLSTRTPTSSSSPRADRRIRPRKRIATAATLVANGRALDAVAVDVSIGGAKVVSTAPIAVGTRVSVVVIVEGEIVDAVATVMWSGAHGGTHHAAGLAFEQLEHEARVHLARFCGVAAS